MLYCLELLQLVQGALDAIPQRLDDVGVEVILLAKLLGLLVGVVPFININHHLVLVLQLHRN